MRVSGASVRRVAQVFDHDPVAEQCGVVYIAQAVGGNSVAAVFGFTPLRTYRVDMLAPGQRAFNCREYRRR